MNLLDVGAGLSSDPATLGEVRHEWLEARAEVVLGGSHDRNTYSQLLLRAAHGLVVEERDDRLAERHALDREEAVPARVQLVDDDVRLAVALEGVVVVKPLDEDEVGVEALAGLENVLGPLPSA